MENIQFLHHSRKEYSTTYELANLLLYKSFLLTASGCEQSNKTKTLNIKAEDKISLIEYQYRSSFIDTTSDTIEYKINLLSHYEIDTPDQIKAFKFEETATLPN